MGVYSKIAKLIKRDYIIFTKQHRRTYHAIPFLDLYEKATGDIVSKDRLSILVRKHPNIDTLSNESLQFTLGILNKFGITTLEACKHPHVFVMNPITLDNYGEILKECGFVNILPNHIIKYHTLVRSRTIAFLKKEGLIKADLNLEEVLYDYFPELPAMCRSLENFPDSTTSILIVRMSVLEKYLKWRLSVTSEEFQRYCRNYLPLKHKPMSDIKEALTIAEDNIMFSKDEIRRNGFIISTDPIKSKLIIDNVKSLAGMDIRQVIRTEPAILKNNYNALLQIRDLLEEYRISDEAQRRCLKVYCMKPQTVKERLEDLINMKEYQILSTNPRVLSMVVHKRKMIKRLSKIKLTKKQCYSLNHLVSSNNVFNNYITSFGNRVCGRDISILINTSLIVDNNKSNTSIKKSNSTESLKATLNQLKKHKYWLHSALSVIDENIQYLKLKFDNKTILEHCQLLLYPISEIKYYVEILLEKRNGLHPDAHLDASYNNLKFSALSDQHILSLVLYEIEKKYHFSGDGVWTNQDGIKLDSKAVN
ncbi:transcription termination factor 5, mitochondrial-like [Galleria mellonella]|uniref:Transcription termination factor 5, mitochondrial-like n=1 Tax=Galleria mellonella TaxID=7137 RepID=A0A6J1X8Y2_GALME|nr:transcription termination factor 5, mitochondrial-like [Galleria mellonella]